MKISITISIAFLVVFMAEVLIAKDYVDNGDGTITDNKTKLTWQQSSHKKMRWEIGKVFCQKLKLAGYSNWRMPSKIELLSLVERSMFNPSIDRKFFPTAKAESYWSGSEGTISAGSAAWLVDFGFGATHFFNRSNKYAVRCVR